MATVCYKTLDGGKTWKNAGLRDSRAIGKVIVNPRNPDIVFVAALGHPFGPNAERGIFRTLDGGKTWEKVLYRDENAGGIDVAFDPRNSNVLVASLWEVRRTPWSLSSGGAGSGLYRSNDGGTTWKRLEDKGLPKGPYGRIGVGRFAANSERWYALIQARRGGWSLSLRTTVGTAGNSSTATTTSFNGRGTTCTSLPTRRMRKRST